ncbi:hypothetical protein SAMN05444157_3578 [Frankineae bacterium MT45]|nr:hypothetical protein SAMN05444157_3578 [Frankineae bacterium MT45]
MATQLYTNAVVFTAGRRAWAEAIVVTGEFISYVGDIETARRIAPSDCVEIDLGGALVVPGFVDGHAHVLMSGESRTQANLVTAPDLKSIQESIASWAAANPDAQRVRAFGWLHAAVGGNPTREMLDAVVPDRPVYAQAMDFHSVWVNSAALIELGIDDQTPDPAGGRIVRDSVTGEATGHIDETAVSQLVWPLLSGLETDADRDRQLARALEEYRRSGVTAAIDMGLDEQSLAAMQRAEQAGTLTARLVAHWVVHRDADPAVNLAHVARAAELAAAQDSEWLRVTGIKIIVDGTVDGCTAALGKPYADGSLPAPMWDLDELAPVVAAADAAGLQVAMHAIGDEAIRVAIAAVEYAVSQNGPRPRRHRIEHLEVAERADIERLAALGITASMQPVHADPAIQANWREMLGDERVERGFPWPEMVEAGALLAFGTDSPTAPHEPLPNMYVAATRRSAFDSSLEPNVERFALPLADAIRHATHDSAWACRSENQFGHLAAGLYADFVVLDRNIFQRPVEELLQAEVLRTVVGGRTVFQS